MPGGDRFLARNSFEGNISTAMRWYNSAEAMALFTCPGAPCVQANPQPGPYRPWSGRMRPQLQAGCCRAARVRERFGGDLPRACESGGLARIRGIGKAGLAIVGQALGGQELDARAAVRDKVPDGLLAARRIKGLGPARARTLWQELGLTTVAEVLDVVQG